MTSRRSHPLSTLLKRPQFNRLFRHAEKVKAADVHLQAYLPAPLAGHVQIGNLDANTLILLADSAAIATRLQFLSNELLDYMRIRAGLATIQRIKVRTQYRQKQKPRRQNRPAQSLSADSAELVSNVADMIEDEKLATVLKRIASHAK